MGQWYDDETFWDVFGPSMFSASRWERAAEEVDGVIALSGAQPGYAALDLCCGPARHSLELARRGFRVTAVDRTAAYVEQARAHAEQQGLQLELVTSDMREFVRDDAFDLAINLFTSFGFFADAGDDRRVLAQTHRSLRPSGVLVMDLIGKEAIARKFVPRRWDRLDDGSLLLQENALVGAWQQMDNRWVLVRDGVTTERRFRIRLYSAQELLTLLESVGFTQAEVYGSLQGIPYDHEAQRLVVVARK